ncbi:hypothetical protein J0X19_03570 [Hymenobacter sp. BT186]|uniref:Outer membrane protein beta-barrel domain-containing protein n=1 Tax=Hymenobacter telluris TaxID=2816474 RepID=A0A939JBQ0_9BACT|nr:hypothetical protein [Hymenobacter telluris]MBO0357013.1 hypothetical protein [Hymenobacter telluris]MBW3373040.1 hypothetical protein [Hymenobacter norwichensis]
MKSAFALVLLSAGLTATSAIAQTKTATKPAAAKTSAAKVSSKTSTATKPAATRTTTTARPAAKPVAKPAAQPAAKPAPTTPAPATPPPASSPKLEIPGVAPQQAPSFAKGTIGVNLGLGLGNGYGYGYSGLGGSLHSSPAISLSVEKGILEGIGPGVISVGGLVGYKSDSYTWDILGNDYKSTWSNIYIAARGAYHYNFTDNPKVDTYAGVSLAARITRYSTNYSDNSIGDYANKTRLEGGIFLGGRYLFTDKLGAFAELGYDMSYLKLGLTSKF